MVLYMTKFVNIVTNLLKTKVGLASVIAGAFILAAALIIVPFLGGFHLVNADSVSCSNPPTVATLNFWPITFTGEPCKDYPAISGHIQGANYPQNLSEYNQGVTAHNGDEITVRLYIHNGAADNLDPAQTTARNVRVATNVDTSTGSDHVIGMTFSSDNTNTVTSSLNIKTNSNEYLVPESGSGTIFDYFANPLQSGINVANTTVSLGNMQACFQYSKFITFKLKVVAQPAPTHTPTPTPIYTPTPTPLNPVCTLTWSSPTTSDGRGIRQIGQLDRVDISLTGFQPNSTVFIRNTNQNNNTHVAAPINIGSNGSFGVYDQTVVDAGSYSIGNYLTSVFDGNGNYLASCKSFVIVPIETPTPTPPTPTPTPPTPTPTPPTPTPSPTPTPTIGGALTCSPSFQSVNVGQPVSFVANGDNGSYTWSTDSSASPASATGSAFTTLFNSGGSKVVSVSSKDGQSTGCTVNVNYNYYYTPTPTPYQNGYISVTKNVSNITQGTYQQKSINANSGDTIEFVIVVNASGGNSANNVRVTDFLPAGLNYIYGSTNVSGYNGAAYPGDNITSGGIYLGNMPAYSSTTIRFRATVASQYYGSYNNYLTNTVNVSSDNAGSASDTATIYISQVNPINPVINNQISIQKFGKDITHGDTAELSTVNANPGDGIEFDVHVKSLSGSTITNIFVQDTLPPGVSYVLNTTEIDGALTGDGVTSGGLNIGTLSPYQERVIKFNVVVAKSASGSLINTVQAHGDNVPAVSAQLPINISTGKVLGITTKVATGAGTVLFSSILSAILAGLMLVYGRSYFAQRRTVGKVIAKQARDKNKFNFI